MIINNLPQIVYVHLAVPTNALFLETFWTDLYVA